MRLTDASSVPLNEVYRLIAGHNKYHGDAILSALTCVAEGKTVSPIRPLKYTPTIEAEPVKCGEWIVHRHEYPQFDPNVYECEVCHKGTDYPSTYCPSCGAKMKGADV